MANVAFFLLCGSYHIFQFSSTGSDMYMLASTVSSKLLQKMAEKEGFQFMVSRHNNSSHTLSHRWSASMYDAVKIISRCGVRICIVDYHTDSIAI